jgi:O-antigen biosynthesis protein
MARVAFPSYDVQTLNTRAGGVGAFITQFAKLLKENGDEVTIILTRRDGVAVDQPWRDNYRARGIELIEVFYRDSPDNCWPPSWTMRLSEQVALLLRGFDVVYFSDWGNVGFHTVRTKRFTDAPLPVCVTIMHGPSRWIRFCEQTPLRIPDDLYLESVEQYAARHSDFVVSPSRFMADWAREQGWKFSREPEVLGLPYRPETAHRPHSAASKLTRLAFFGRLQALKGYDIFVQALELVKHESPETLGALGEVVLLGHEDVAGSVEQIRYQLARIGLPLTHLGDLDSMAAQDYLARHVPDTLVVVPSRLENFPFAVIEASLIPGLNLICTRGGGTAEIFAGGGEEQLFDPNPGALAIKLRERLTNALAPEQLLQYDFQAANQRWVQFHQRACQQALATRAVYIEASPRAHSAIDVCISYSQAQSHFPQLCESLALQTSKDFRVIAVDESAADEKSLSVFDTMTEKYSALGWTFVRPSPGDAGLAGNHAAAKAKAEYLLRIDADDVLAPNAIDRMLQAIRISGDDCIVPNGYVFVGDKFPYHPNSIEVTAQIIGYLMPPGVVAGLAMAWEFGDPMRLIRRSVFEATGGDAPTDGAAHQEWTSLERLAASGYKVDVLPEFLYFHRQPRDLSMSLGTGRRL